MAKEMKPARFQVGDYVAEAAKGVGTALPLASRRGTIVKAYIEVEKKGGSRRRKYDIVWDGLKQPVIGVAQHRILKKVEKV